MESAATTMSSEKQSVVRAMVLFLVPVVLSSVLQSLGQVFGAVVVGQTLGVDSLAAISAFFPLYFFLVSFAIGIGSGSSILIGQAYGGGHLLKVKEVVGITLAFTSLVSVVLACLGTVFAERILFWMGTPENILDASAVYARILFATLPITYLYIVYTTLLRGVGDSKTPFYFLIVSTAINLILLPVLIFGWFGLPALHLNGAAYASVCAGLFTLALLLLYLHKKKHALMLDARVFRHFRLEGAVLKNLVRLAIPTSISMVALSMSEIAVLTFVNEYGSNATAAYGVVNQIASYVMIPGMSISIAVSVFVAQSIGSGNHAALKQITKTGIALNYLFGGAVILLICVSADPILRMFVDHRETLEIARSLILLSFWGYVFMGHTMTISATMRATGTVLWPTIFTISSIWVVQVPVAYVLSQMTPLGLHGVWIAYPIAFLFNLAVQSVYYRCAWKKKTHQVLVPE